jgi:precorrin-6A synthase
MVLAERRHMLRSADGEHDACWGAYVGMPEEILVSAKLKDVVDDIERVRSAAPVRMAGSSIV